jgi:hypothetical protein
MANKQDGTPLLPMYDSSRSRSTSMYGSTGLDAAKQKKDGDARYARRSRTFRSIALAALVNSPSASLKVTNFTCCSSFGTVYFPTADNSAMFAVVALTRKLTWDMYVFPQSASRHDVLAPLNAHSFADTPRLVEPWKSPVKKSLTYF